MSIMPLGVFLLYEPAHDKTYNKTCMNIKVSDQFVQPPSTERVIVYSFLNSMEDSDQTAQMHRLILVFAGRTSLIAGSIIFRGNHMVGGTVFYKRNF